MKYVLNADLINEGMERQQFTLADLSRASKIAFATIKSAREGGNVSFRTAWELADALQLDVRQLIGTQPTIGEALYANRLASGLSRHKLAELAGITYGTLVDWESDKRIPTIWNAYYVATALGKTINECFGLDAYSDQTEEMSSNEPTGLQ